MTTLRVAAQMLRERRRSTVWWSVGIGLLMVLIGAAYPSVRDSGDVFEQYMEQLPDSLVEAFGLAGASITSPEGYLVSQLYSNMYVIVLLVLGLGMAAWAIAGSESDGTLEMVMANPVRRVEVALGRVLGMVIVLSIVNVVGHLVLAAYAPSVGLDQGLPTWAFAWAALASFAFVAVHVALAFAAGAATGRRGLAIGLGAGLALVGFLVNAMAGVAEAFRTARDYSPWYWLLQENPVSTAPGLVSFWLPMGLSALLVGLGTWAFHRRDVAG